MYMHGVSIVDMFRNSLNMCCASLWMKSTTDQAYCVHAHFGRDQHRPLTNELQVFYTLLQYFACSDSSPLA
jgi:hypothetical protein